jgi:hypothetical protein
MTDDELIGLLKAAEDRLVGRINNQHERLLEAIKALSKDFQNTKGFLIEDAIVLGRRTTNVEDRLDKLDKPGT